MEMREHLQLSREIQDFAIADIILSCAFALAIVGGVPGLAQYWSDFLYLLPIAFVAVSLSFILHELMHKIVAQKFGAIAAFRTSMSGLMITVITAFIGFVVGIPGATMIYTNNFTKREEGIVSLAGPLTNFTIFVCISILGVLLFPNFIHQLPGIINDIYNLKFTYSYLETALGFALYISILLAFFNMLPIYPLDGSKVLRWHPWVFGAVIVGIFVIIIGVLQFIAILPTMIFMLIIAVFFSLFYRGIGL